MRFRNRTMREHGKGALYSYELRWNEKRYPFPALRVSLGGYGWDLAWYRPHYQRWPNQATHFGIGPLCFSILRGR